MFGCFHTPRISTLSRTQAVRNACWCQHQVSLTKTPAVDSSFQHLDTWRWLVACKLDNWKIADGSCLDSLAHPSWLAPFPIKGGEVGGPLTFSFPFPVWYNYDGFVDERIGTAIIDMKSMHITRQARPCDTQVHLASKLRQHRIVYLCLKVGTDQVLQ